MRGDERRVADAFCAWLENQRAHRLIQLDAALMSANVNVTQCDDGASRISPVINVDLPVPKMFVDLRHPVSEAVPSLERLRLEAAMHLNRGVDLVVGEAAPPTVPSINPWRIRRSLATS